MSSITAAADLSVYLVTDAAASAPRAVLDVIALAVSGGVSAVQIREKTASASELYALVVEASRVIDGRAALLVDDRLDIVLAARQAGARVDGVHLGQSDLPVAAARALLGEHAIVGLTANTPEHLAAVAALPAGTVDYLGLGVIRPTATKPDHPEPLGIDGFARLAATTALPCVAIGGVALGDAAALRAAGAAGLAIVSAIASTADPSEAARAFRAAWAAR
ncbi:thiamine phosphate synthase [Compostimonas suwonensis]|uniref:Thiamine-phosphate synthase n=1 Tax=Compostimonas suwonensis TaxID=1048394 RepID=A0A2M9BU54_9MICO|nr:thiamine phosphate synthase [Compostimonas suwonensis]PJJ61460.1 thiamine-phosphate pyrophosphorylase [Compostimonas suwonensis]